MSKARWSQVWAVGLLLAVGGLYVWGTYQFYTSRYNGGNDFFSRYVAWRAFLLEGHNPYSDEVTHTIQLAINGRLALPGEDENALIYPWYAVVLQWPFVFMPWPWARAVYMVLCQVFIATGLGFTAQLLHWKLPPLLFTATALWAVLFYPEGRGLILGQIVITQYFLTVLTLWLLQQKHEVWAGVCLALTTARPTAVFLLVPFLLLWALWRRRFRFVAACLITLTLLCAAGFWLLPTWLTDWLYRLGRYPAYTIGQSPVWLLAHQVLPLGVAGEVVLTLVCLAGLGWAWWRVRQGPGEEAFHWALGVTLVVSDLVVPRSATTNYIFLLFPTYLIFAALCRTWPRAGRWVMLALELGSLVGLWWLFFVTVQGDVEAAIMYIPSVVCLGLALGLGYRWLIVDNRRAKIGL
jgi:hypothetical protein